MGFYTLPKYLSPHANLRLLCLLNLSANGRFASTFGMAAIYYEQDKKWQAVFAMWGWKDHCAQTTSDASTNERSASVFGIVNLPLPSSEP
jgi:hypothetical protein